MRLIFAAMMAAAIAASAQAQTACGGDVPCEIETGVYHVALPEAPEGAPMVVWLHGYGGAGSKAVANTGFANGFTGRGYALIAPDGLKWHGPESKTEWSVRDGYPAYPRNDQNFVRAVIDDAASRFHLDRSRVFLTGFSRGGSMVWDIACLWPKSAAAYASISGGFWKPGSEECAGPVHLLHTHGFSDRIVPLEGRPIFNPPFFGVQSEIDAGLLTFRREMNCAQRATEVDVSGPLWRKEWTECEGGSVTFLLGPGGHGIPTGWTTLALDWFESLPDIPPLEAKPASD